MKRRIESNFPDALRYVRKAQDMTQEDFDEVSSRVYVSALERGLKQPTLAKIDSIANALGVHPLTLLALSYCSKLTAEDVARLCEKVKTEADMLAQA